MLRACGDDPQAAPLCYRIARNATHARRDAGAEAIDIPAPLEPVMHCWASREVVAPLLQGLMLHNERRQPELRSADSSQTFQFTVADGVNACGRSFAWD
jgi:hypothetical protein